MKQRKLINLVVCMSMIASMSVFTSCSSAQDTKLRPGTYYLTAEQKEQLHNSDVGWVTSLVTKTCSVPVAVTGVGVQSMQTDVFDSAALGDVRYSDMFLRDDMVDIAGLLKFGTEPFYIHKDIGSSDVQLVWSYDRIHSIGSDFKRFYRVQSDYTDANINLYIKICEEYLNDGSILVAEFNDGREINVDDINRIKALISGFDKNDTEGLSVYRKDNKGRENLRIRYIPATKTIKISSWEGDSVVFATDNVDPDDSIETVEFVEASLPFYQFASSAVIPANLPMNGVTMVYGTDNDGSYHGQLDFEFIANEDQAAQIVQFYARYYPEAKLDRNRIELCSNDDEEFTLTVSYYEDRYKVLVFHRKNVNKK